MIYLIAFGIWALILLFFMTLFAVSGRADDRAEQMHKQLTRKG